jgi:hypothetical protein
VSFDLTWFIFLLVLLFRLLNVVSLGLECAYQCAVHKLLLHCNDYSCCCLGKTTISNDGATLMKLLDVVHPAAKTLVDISLSQDAEVHRNFNCTLNEDNHRWVMVLLQWY